MSGRAVGSPLRGPSAQPTIQRKGNSSKLFSRGAMPMEEVPITKHPPDRTCLAQHIGRSPARHHCQRWSGGGGSNHRQVRPPSAEPRARPGNHQNSNDQDRYHLPSTFYLLSSDLCPSFLASFLPPFNLQLFCLHILSSGNNCPVLFSISAAITCPSSPCSLSFSFMLW